MTLKRERKGSGGERERERKRKGGERAVRGRKREGEWGSNLQPWCIETVLQPTEPPSQGN